MSADPSAPSIVPPPPFAGIDQARHAWISRLIDLSQRNNLLYFRKLKVGNLDLTSAHPDLVAELLSGKSVTLGKLLPEIEREQLTAQAGEIARKARENREERGLETLSLAAGMASWRGEDGKRPPEAAVLLVPITLDLRDRGGATLKRNGEPQMNPVLLHVLKTNFRCAITAEALLAAADTDPESDDDLFNLDTLLAKLLELAHSIDDFSVSRTAYLGNFSFQKMAMVRDLQDNAAQLQSNDVIAGLAGDPAARQRALGDGVDPDPRQFDAIPPEKEFLVLDTDSSQQKAIAIAEAGRSAVIQGPPGTGKSQVIANLIVSLAAKGKRILFVAEKRAALQVVQARLERAGLGSLALDLHGADTSKKIIAGRLRDALVHLDTYGASGDASSLAPFIKRRDRVNAHATQMHSPRKPTDQSVFQLQARLLKPITPTQLKTRFRGDALLKINAATIAIAKDLLTEAASQGDLFLGGHPSPWAKAQLTQGHEVQAAIDLVTRLTEETLPALRADAEAKLVPHCIAPPADVADIVHKLQIATEANAFLLKFKAEIFQADLPSLITALEPAEDGWFLRALAGFINGGFRRAKKTMMDYSRSGLVGPLDSLQAARLAVDLLKRWPAEGFASKTPVTIELAEPLLAAFTSLQNALSDLTKRLLCKPLDRLPLDELATSLAALRDDAATARRIPGLRKTEADLAAAGLNPLVAELRQTRPSGDTWPAALETAWLRSSLEHAIADEPDLAAFAGQAHDKFVREFCELDRDRLQDAAMRAGQQHVVSAKKALAEHAAQAGIVRREAEKKTRHLPFRKLIDQAPDVLAKLFPCFMCSPLSVSQLLPGDKRLFDVVIFDEASQVLPEDAVPSLMRAGQAVVAGDRHQLPPTQFFADGNDADDDLDTPEDSATEGFDSLLSMMSAFVPSPMLEWHYRSRDERLIAFSNKHVYDGRLITFPSPGVVGGIQHVLVDAKENTGGNVESASAEVQKVVEVVIAHAETQMKLESKRRQSLGVIALGITHARRVEAAIDLALRDRDDLQPLFDPAEPERFFVKNLERVQGDERDVILLTLGIVPDDAGRVSLSRFGPLNSREHGYRRLNVAITRARQGMIVVSSFKADAIDPSKAMSRGMELLRLYLQYASANGRMNDNVGRTAGEVNAFEADIASVLAEQGIQTLPQWGSSGYRVGLVAQHPQRPERLVLAIECDGSTYHSAPTARDRDRLREQQLEALGWSFHRIWSTDWFNRRDDEIKRLLDACHAAIANADKADGVEPPPPPAM